MTVQLHLGDCLEVMAGMDTNSIDTIITDPPYGLSFMGKDWDHGIPGVAFWREALRVAKPGAMLLAFGGTRTYHRLACAIEDAGWEIRDCMMWLYGSGFPKSHDISKAIDKTAGAEREVVGRAVGMGKQNPEWNGTARGRKENSFRPEYDATAPATPAAAAWDGWGTSLKPAFEPVLVAQKPLSVEQEQDIIVGNLLQLEAQLWLLLHASTVEKDSRLSRAELDAALSIAQWTVAKSISTRDALRGQMDMSPFASAIATTLSTVSLWRGILEEALSRGNTSTTATELSTTIDWKTLSFLLSEITLESIIRAEIEAPGSRLSALPAGAYLNAVAMRQSAIRTLSALESATSEARALHRGVAGKELSPNWEPVIVAMKPLDGTFANNALTHGVAGLWIDGARIATGEDCGRPQGTMPQPMDWGNKSNGDGETYRTEGHPAGRWPANLILSHHPDCQRVGTRQVKNKSGSVAGTEPSHTGDENTACYGEYKRVAFDRHADPDGLETVEDWDCHPDCPVRLLGEQSGESTSAGGANAGKLGVRVYGKYDGQTIGQNAGGLGDTGTAARFFYQAKASKRERWFFCHICDNAFPMSERGEHTHDKEKQDHIFMHPTQKPEGLMEYLCKLTKTPTGGVVLDPFMGTGTTGVVCVKTGRGFIGIDQDSPSCVIAKRRIAAGNIEPEEEPEPIPVKSKKGAVVAEQTRMF